MSGRRRKLRVGLAALLTVCLAVVVAACGSDSGGGGGSGSEKKITGAKVIDPASMDNPPKGTIHYCQGKDTNGAAHENVALFNKKYASKGYKVELTEFPADAGQQRAQFIQRQQAKSDDCDVFSSDVIWTAEFASQKWLYDMTPYVEKAKDKYIAAPLETVHYGGKYWGAPASSDAAFIFYRTDKGSGKPPATWQELYADAKKSGGMVYQGAPYEGLTCDFLEIAFAAGGKVLSDDGKKSEINSPENEKALQLMVSGIKDGAAPKAVTTYMEPETDQAWRSGRYAYMRNWTYAYAADNDKKDSKVAGKYKVAPLPDVRGRRQGRHPRRPQQRDQRVHQEPGPRAEVRRLHGEPRVAEDPAAQVLGRVGRAGRLQRSGREEGGPVRARAAAGAEPGEVAPGVAGEQPDLTGDLQERQRRACRSGESEGRADEGGQADHKRPLDVLS